MERKEKILDLLSIHRTMSIHQLSTELFCSISSLRRDLIELEKTGSIRRIRGGATLCGGTTLDYSSSFREAINNDEKNYIAEIARDFLANGMSLFLDSSSTVSKICPFLDTLRHITVVTNGLGTALLLNNSTHVNTFITGGQLRNGSATLMGEKALEWTTHFKADLAIISCRGIDQDGVYEADIGQASIKQHMMAHSKQSILLVDHSKFDTYYFHKLCHFDQFQAVITDKQPADHIKHSIENHGCEILY